MWQRVLAQEQQEEAQRKQSAQPVSANELASERGVDYTRLRDLMKAGKCKEADRETADRMCEVMGRQKEGWLRVEDMQNFPCTDLRTIEHLWATYSLGTFGFSVQKKIWQECGSPTKYNSDWEKFCDRVGWRKNGKWLEYSDLNPSLSSLQGKFPVRPFFRFRPVRRVVSKLCSLLSRPDL